MVNRLMGKIPHWWDWLPIVAVLVYMIYTAYDVFVPVLWMQSTVVSKDPDSVVLAIKGWKFRECRFHGVQAYSVDKDGYRHWAETKRIDRPEKRTTHPIGKFDIGQWDVRPLIGGAGVLVYVHYACDTDDMRLTKLAEVKL